MCRWWSFLWSLGPAPALLLWKEWAWWGALLRLVPCQAFPRGQAYPHKMEHERGRGGTDFFFFL